MNGIRHVVHVCSTYGPSVGRVISLEEDHYLASSYASGLSHPTLCPTNPIGWYVLMRATQHRAPVKFSQEASVVVCGAWPCFSDPNPSARKDCQLLNQSQTSSGVAAALNNDTNRHPSRTLFWYQRVRRPRREASARTSFAVPWCSRPAAFEILDRSVPAPTYGRFREGAWNRLSGEYDGNPGSGYVPWSSLAWMHHEHQSRTSGSCPTSCCAVPSQGWGYVLRPVGYAADSSPCLLRFDSASPRAASVHRPHSRPRPLPPPLEVSKLACLSREAA